MERQVTGQILPALQWTLDIPLEMLPTWDFLLHYFQYHPLSVMVLHLLPLGHLQTVSDLWDPVYLHLVRRLNRHSGLHSVVKVRRVSLSALELCSNHRFRFRQPLDLGLVSLVAHLDNNNNNNNNNNNSSHCSN